MNKTMDKEEAIEVITLIMQDVNRVYEDIQQGAVEDSSEIRDKMSRIGPLDIYNCLPKTSCGDCGESTCMAFAVRLLAGETTLDRCSPLNTSDHTDQVECLEELLGDQIMRTMGWKDHG